MAPPPFGHQASHMVDRLKITRAQLNQSVGDLAGN